MKKIAIAEIKVAEVLSSQTGNENPDGLEKEIRAAIRGVFDYFVINNDGNKITVNPHAENRRTARLRDGKCLLFTTNFEKSASEIIATYFGKDVIYIFICYLAYRVLALYKHHLGVTGWEGVEDSLDELGRIRKTTLDFGGENGDKISVLTKEQKEIIEKVGFADMLFGL